MICKLVIPNRSLNKATSFHNHDQPDEFLLGNFKYILVVIFRDHQCMVFVDGMDIQERVNTLILIYFPGFGFPIHDLAEYAIVHHAILPSGCLFMHRWQPVKPSNKWLPGDGSSRDRDVRDIPNLEIVHCHCAGFHIKNAPAKTVFVILFIV
jgi:hypothetical protein